MKRILLAIKCFEEVTQNACPAVLLSLRKETLNGVDMWSCMEESQSQALVQRRVNHWADVDTHAPFPEDRVGKAKEKCRGISLFKK